MATDAGLTALRVPARSAAPARPAVPASFVPRRGAAHGAEIGRTARSRAVRLNLLAGAIALLVALFHVWTGLRVGRLGYELSHARDLGQRLDQQLKELSIEFSATMKPDLLAAEAQRRLGLDWPRSGQIVDVP